MRIFGYLTIPLAQTFRVFYLMHIFEIIESSNVHNLILISKFISHIKFFEDFPRKTFQYDISQ